MAVVNNLAEFTVWCLRNQVPAPGQVATYNFIDYPQMPISRTIDIVHEELDKPRPKLTVPMSAAMAGGFVFDIASSVLRKKLPISRARIKKLSMTTQFEGTKIDDCGFQKSLSTEQGLRNMVQWYVASNAGVQAVEVDWISETNNSNQHAHESN